MSFFRKWVTLLFLLNFSVTLSFASELSGEKKFQEAKKLFAEKKYEAAYELFSDVFINNLQDPNVNFYLGQTSFMLKNYSEAISAYERILFVDDTAVRPKLEIARSYIGLKAYAQAMEILQSIDRKNIPVNVQKNIDKYIQLIKEKEQKNQVQGVFIVGVGRDDNVKNTADLFNNTPGLQKVSSNLHQELLVLNHKYIESPLRSFKNDFIVMLKNFTSNPQSDLKFFQYAPAISMYYDNQLSIDYAIFYNHIWIGDKSTLKNYGLFPKIYYMHSKNILVNSSLKYQNKVNVDASKRDQDSDFFELASTISIQHKEYLSSSSYVKLSREKRLRGNLTNIDYNGLDIGFSVAYTYNQNISTSARARYFHKSYLDALLSQAKRSDDEYQVFLNLNYAFAKNYIVQAEYSYTDHQSNDSNYEFDKNTIMVNLITLF